MSDTSTADVGPAGPGSEGRVGPRRFVRQVVAELKKVVYPTRNELITYTAVVMVFVSAVMVYIAGLDFVFQRAVDFVFGG